MSCKEADWEARSVSLFIKLVSTLQVFSGTNRYRVTKGSIIQGTALSIGVQKSKRENQTTGTQEMSFGRYIESKKWRSTTLGGH